jgi:DNA-directed RNA polymerase specialized sigma24 family protein
MHWPRHLIVDRTDFQLPSDILSWLTMNVIDAAEKIEITDDQLMKAVVDRKTEALECIYLKYESLLGAVILGVIRDESEVDDILHDVMLQVWEQGDRYNPSGRGLPGLLVILARPRAIDRLRRKATHHHVTEGLKDGVDNPLL